MAQKAIIESLGEKIARLIAENERLREEYGAALADRNALKAANRELKATLAAQENRIKLLELSSGLTGAATGNGGDTKQARARINRLMREIDRCIALMNQ